VDTSMNWPDWRAAADQMAQTRAEKLTVTIARITIGASPTWPLRGRWKEVHDLLVGEGLK
jgi:hypothetical protein